MLGLTCLTWLIRATDLLVQALQYVELLAKDMESRLTIRKSRLDHVHVDFVYLLALGGHLGKVPHIVHTELVLHVIEATLQRRLVAFDKRLVKRRLQVHPCGDTLRSSRYMERG